MKTIKYKSKHFGFQISVPDGWSRSITTDLFVALSDTNKYFGYPPREVSDSRTILGPNGKYLNILITPLSENKSEPTINETKEYFDGLTYRQNLNVIATGTIDIANKEHFWATYYKMTLIGVNQVQIIKKYCLYLNKAEYLITAELGRAGPGEKLPDDQAIENNEKVYDEIISSFRLLND
ncbi:MAG: hypothetical protein ABSB41_17500 [Anaerolineales bacterium]|jgi:hypothetical protein